MKSMITIFADKGKILTDGSVYGEVISLAVGKSAEDFYEITIEEYEQIMAEQEKEALENGFGT